MGLKFKLCRAVKTMTRELVPTSTRLPKESFQIKNEKINNELKARQVTKNTFIHLGTFRLGIVGTMNDEHLNRVHSTHAKTTC